MLKIRNSRALAGRAGLSVFSLSLVLLVGCRITGGSNHSITFTMPACPINQKTVASTKVPFRLPFLNLLRGPRTSASGTIQFIDQTGSTVLLLQPDLTSDQTGLSFTRTVRTLQHATAQVTFDKGCTSTDPYGSKNCHWNWDENVTLAYQGALQENISAGRMIVDLQFTTATSDPDNPIVTPLQFACPICGAPCTTQISPDIDNGRLDRVLHLLR